MRHVVAFPLLLLAILCPAEALAQRWGDITGTVVDDLGLPLPSVTVVVDGTNYGTATTEAGTYALRIPEGRYLLRFSAVGFAPVRDSVVVRRNRATVLDARLLPTRIVLDEVTIEDSATPQDAGVYDLAPQDIQRIPGPFRDVVRALKVMPGVATNNELSNQYSVRGGGFNENLLFLDGYEVFLPFRPRQGEQEGLSLLNPDLAERVTFYTGGFPARYGGKLSSALDVRYRHPDAGAPPSGAAALSLLDASVHAGAATGRASWIFGVRKARARHFFAGQELKGDYRPDYTDLQGRLTYRLSARHDAEALALWADHSFRLDPSARKTFFGTLSQNSQLAPSNLKSLWIRYDPDSEETDGYTSRFGGLRLNSRLSPTLHTSHDVSYFATRENERFTLAGQSILFQVDPGSGNPQGGEGLRPTGTVRHEDGADNQIDVAMWTAQGRWMYTTRRHAAEGGWMARHLRFDDRLDEKSVVVGRSTEGTLVRIVADSLRDSASLTASQGAFYVQDAIDVLPTQPGRLLVTGGLRVDYFSFNGQWTASPRLSARYRLDARTTLTAAWGLYHQAPSYRELRGQPAPGETILGALNRDLKAQRSMQLVAGAEVFLPETRLYLRSEAFYKHITHVISYDIDNVRVRYSGENDAESDTYGLDLQLRGEFVPGLESWLNYSLLVAQETFLPAFQTPYNTGRISRPTDQRHTISLFIQDYITGDPSWKLHMRTLFGSGLPYTPPVPGPQVGTLVSQVPGPRFSARYPRYFRIDLGITKEVTVFERGLGQPVTLDVTAEVLNIFNMVNTVAYTWVPDAFGTWNRIPTRLTPRTLNVRARVTF